MSDIIIEEKQDKVDINVLLEYIKREPLFNFVLGSSYYLNKERAALSLFINWIKYNPEEMKKWEQFQEKWSNNEIY